MASYVEPVPAETPTRAEDELVRVYVWQWPVRIVHWTIAISIAGLSITGMYMHMPYVAVHSNSAWTMGTMRFVHELFGFALLSALILRIYWYFAGNRWSRWGGYFPHTAFQRRRLKGTVRYYTFREKLPMPEVGHNPLAGMFYLGVYFLVAVECLTGLTLYAEVSHNTLARVLTGWLLHMVDIQYLRLTHYLVMFLLIAFFVHHLYSALVNAFDLKNGLMGSIFSGWKFMPRSVVQEDAAESRKVTRKEKKTAGE
jgi:Ni/Fe-hydrogenase 1 B-type cytochrome subunit